MSNTRVGVAALAVVLIAGCGGGGNGGDKGDKTEDKAPTTSEARKAAKAILLTEDDLPSGFTGKDYEESEDDGSDKEFAECIGATPPEDDFFELHSDDFTKGEGIEELEVSSEVSVVESTEKVRADLKAYQRTSKVKRCLETIFGEKLEESGDDTVTFGDVEADDLDVSVDGTDGGFGYVIRTTATAGGQEVPLEFAIVGFLKDRTKVTLETSSVGEPFPSDVRDELLEILLDRAKDEAV